MNLATADLFQAEIARLQAEIARLRLTDAEREAVEECYEWAMTADHRSLAATLRVLLDRLSPIKTAESDRPKAIATPEPAIPPGWTSRPYWVDPPSGHRYGFPRLYDPSKDGDMTEWMIANGYPERLARQGLACTFTLATEDVEK